MSRCGGRSSVGRAQDCDSCGRGFDPLRPPHFSFWFDSAFGECIDGSLALGYSSSRCARVAELVDALDLGSSGATRESSSLSSRTTPFFFLFRPHLCLQDSVGPVTVRHQTALQGDSLGGAKHDKLPAFNFRSFAGVPPKPDLYV